MTPPSVLLDCTFLDALVNPAHPQHDAVAEQYLDLVDEFEDGTVRLLALDEDLRLVVPGMPAGSLERLVTLWRRLRLRRNGTPVLRDGLLAPVETLHVAPQHRRAADAMLRSGATHDGATPDVDDRGRGGTRRLATTLVMAQRARITRIASLDPALRGYDVQVLGPQPSN